MGQTYSINLKLKFSDEKGAVKALQAKIARGKDEQVNYYLDHYLLLGIGTEKIADLLRIFFGGWTGKLEKHPENTLSSDFGASYGWEGVMMDAFDEMAPFLEDGSSIRIYPDSGVDKGTVKNKKAFWQ